MRLEYKWQVAIISSLGLFMAVLDNTVVNVALPQMQTAFHTDRTTITWVVTAYFLAQAAIIPVTGYLSDLFGSKRVFLAALAVFTIGSALCALSPNERLLIAFRVFQGIGGGALFPVAFALIYRAFPAAERGPASAIIGVPVLLAPAFGPTIGGFLTKTFDWHAIFTINLPFGIVALTLAAILLHDRATEEETSGEAALQRRSFDTLGLLLAMSGFTALVYGISEAASATGGWGNRTVDLFLLAGVVLLVAFVIAELRVSSPVLDLRLFLNSTFTVSNVLMWGVAAFLFGSLILLPFFYESVRGQDPLTTGEILITQGLSAAVATLFVGRVYNRIAASVIGPRLMAVIGFVLITVGTIGLTKFSVTTNGAAIQGALILRGLGLGFTNIPLQTIALSSISNRAMARASSLVNVTRQVAGAVGVAVLSTYLAQQTQNHVASVSTAFRNGPATQLAATCAAHLGRNTAAIQACVQQGGRTYITNHALTMGLNDTFVLASIATGICIVVAVFVGRDASIDAQTRAEAQGERTSFEPRPLVAAE